MRPDVDQLALFGQMPLDELRGDRGKKDLPAVRLAAELGRQVDRRPEIVGASALNLARVDAEPDCDVQAPRPGLGCQGAGGRERGVDRVPRGVERRDGGVPFADRLQEPSATALHAVGDQLVVPHERFRHRGRIGLPQRG